MTTAIIFGVLLHDAEEKWLGRNQLMLALSAHTKVVLLEQPRFSRALIEVRRPRVERLSNNLYVIRDAFGLRYQRVGKRFRWITGLLDARWFHAALKQIGITSYIYWLTVNDPAMALGIPDSSLVYDCMDPNFTPEKQVEFDKSEAILAKRAKMIFCSAHTLHKKMMALNPNSFLLPNACSKDTIKTVQAKEFELPTSLVGRDRPFIGYMGTIDWRFDANYVYEAAKELSDYTFVIVGRINHDQEKNAELLRSLPNVILTGQVSYDEGHAYNLAFDVGLIPFIPGPMNDAINSVKMFMYLASGKPIVSTDIEECRRNPFVIASDSPHSFATNIRHAVTNNSSVEIQSRIDYALKNTWEDRSNAALEHLQSAGLYD